MKIFLLGASGMVGARILAEASARGHKVTAASRNPDKIARLPGVTAVQADAADPASLTNHAEQADVVIGAVSPRSTGDAMAEATAYAEALIMAGGKAPRVVMVGGAGSLTLPDGTPVVDVLPAEYAAEGAAMKHAYGMLRDSGINWTVLAPSAQLAPGKKTGHYHVGGTTLLSDSKGESHISVEDFADALLHEVESPAHLRQLATVGYTA